jgi:hypothetical protein
MAEWRLLRAPDLTVLQVSTKLLSSGASRHRQHGEVADREICQIMAMVKLAHESSAVNLSLGHYVGVDIPGMIIPMCFGVSTVPVGDGTPGTAGRLMIPRLSRANSSYCKNSKRENWPLG